MADVKREQELAERRKQDPQPDLAQDHLVRKIFSKFRKPSETGTGPPGSTSRPGSSTPITAAMGPVTVTDVEKGAQENHIDSNKTATDKPSGELGGGESRVGSAASKTSRWAAALANATNNNNNLPLSDLERDSAENALYGRRTELVCKKSEHIHVVKDVRPPTQGNKWPRVPTGANRPETIEESAEPSDPSGKAEIEQQTKSVASSGQPPPSPPVPPTSGPIVVKPKSINNADYQQIIASLTDMRVDLKLEVQKLSNKIAKIDDHIDELTKQMAVLHVAVHQREPSGSLNPLQQPSAAGTAVSSAATIPVKHKNPDSMVKLIPSDILIPKKLLSKKEMGLGKGEKSSRLIRGSSVPARTKSSSSSAASTTGSVPQQQQQQSHHPQDDDLHPLQSTTTHAKQDTDEVREMLENEIAEQEVEVTDEDQDLTSKL